jgi:hypothetical protein
MIREVIQSKKRRPDEAPPAVGSLPHRPAGLFARKKPTQDPAEKFAEALSQLEQECARETERRQRIDSTDDPGEGADAAPPHPPRKQAGQPVVDDR